MSAPTLTTETEIGEAIIRFLKKSGRKATIREIIEALPDKYIKLSRLDMRHSETRPGERLWEQRVRNIRSHRNSMDGRLLHVSEGFRLSAKVESE